MRYTNLGQILQLLAEPLSEKQAWALCYKCVNHLISKYKKTSNCGHGGFEFPDAIEITEDGEIYRILQQINETCDLPTVAEAVALFEKTRIDEPNESDFSTKNVSLSFVERTNISDEPKIGRVRSVKQLSAFIDRNMSLPTVREPAILYGLPKKSSGVKERAAMFEAKATLTNEGIDRNYTVNMPRNEALKTVNQPTETIRQDDYSICTEVATKKIATQMVHCLGNVIRQAVKYDLKFKDQAAFSHAFTALVVLMTGIDDTNHGEFHFRTYKPRTTVSFEEVELLCRVHPSVPWRTIDDYYTDILRDLVTRYWKKIDQWTQTQSTAQISPRSEMSNTANSHSSIHTIP